MSVLHEPISRCGHRVSGGRHPRETIQSASLTGGGAGPFQIVSHFPIDVPKGQDVTVEVQFTPSSTGTFAADLLLQTAKMGTSQISLVGTGL